MNEEYLGKRVVIFSTSSSRALASQESDGNAIFVVSNPKKSNSTQWTIDRVREGQYFIRNLQINSFLDGRKKEGEIAKTTDGIPYENNFLMWKIMPNREKNEFSFIGSLSNCFLDGRRKEPDPYMTNRPYKDDNFAKWRILPGNTDK